MEMIPSKKHDVDKYFRNRRINTLKRNSVMMKRQLNNEAPCVSLLHSLAKVNMDYNKHGNR